ncbi:MAG: hypothetical protein WHS88_02080 [Anaerohalosphaeraceae bacterium]
MSFFRKYRFSLQVVFLRELIISGTLAFLFFTVGCAQEPSEQKLRTFFERKSTEIESRLILNELSQVRENPHIANPLPLLYRQPPIRLKVPDGVKLFYFTKHNPSGDLSFRSPDKAKEKEVHSLAGALRDLGYKVSSNPTTNQLIIHCADEAEADRVLDFLERIDVPPIQVHIDCLILERFGDITMDWETTLLMENLLGEGITLGASKYPRSAFPGASLRESRRSEFGMDFGFWRNKGIDGRQIRLVVDMLESRGYLKILLNPSIETINGKSATISIRDNAPIELQVTAKGTSETNKTITYTLTDYKWVADTLTVTPRVYADGSIGLQTSIAIGSKSKPEGVVQTSIITERSIQVEENRIAPGQSLIIGGMRKSENRSVIRGIPGLKDLPILGILFSSKDFEEKATEIIFILTPSISSGSIPYVEAAQMVRDKYEAPQRRQTLEEILGDPTGADMYTGLLEKRAAEARAALVRAQREAEEAERLAQERQTQAEEARRQAELFESLRKQALEQIEKARQQMDENRQKTESEEITAVEQQVLRMRLDEQIQQARRQAEAAEAAIQDAQKRAAELEQQAAEAAERAARIRQEQQRLLQIRQTQTEEQKSPDSAESPAAPANPKQ